MFLPRTSAQDLLGGAPSEAAINHELILKVPENRGKNPKNMLKILGQVPLTFSGILHKLIMYYIAKVLYIVTY